MMLKDQEVKRIFTKVTAYSSAYILIPLVLLGAVGYIIDRNLDTAPKFLFIGIGVAFIFSNILLLKKRSFLSKKIKSEVDKITNS